MNNTGIKKGSIMK